MADEKNEQMNQETPAPAQQSQTAAESAPKTFWEKYKARRALKKANQKKKTLKQEIMSWVLTLLAAVVIAMLIRMFLGEAIRVDGDSMTNTLKDGEIVLVAKTPYLFGEIERNDIVICRYPRRENWQINFGGSIGLTGYTLFVKRVVGLPGDVVTILNGKLYINGEEVPDPEFMASAPRDRAQWVLGEDDYFVVGDNRGNSHDSRASDVGPISRSMIQGKVTRVLIPWRDVE